MSDQFLKDKEKEINRLRREIHKLKSVLERSELKRMPSCPSVSGGGAVSVIKKCGVSGESWEDLGPNQRIPKDFRTRQLLRAAIGENDFLKHLDSEQIRDMVDFLSPVTLTPFQAIITEGEPGNHLYVSGEGQLEVLQDEVRLGFLGPGKAFGELALLYNCKRTATVRAVGECKAWALERRIFHQVMVRMGMRRMENRLAFLNSVPLLKDLDSVLLSRIADHLEPISYPAGTFIIRQGAFGDTFFIISRGRVQISMTKDNSHGNSTTEKVNVRELGEGDYFGEQALLRDEKRSADVISLPPGTDCLILDRDSFLTLIGNLAQFQSNQWISQIPASIDKEERDTKEELELQFKSQLPLHIKISKLSLDDLEVVATLGVGGFGRVELVQIGADSNFVFALKCLPKAHILATQQKEHVFAERNILRSCDSEFIVKLYSTLRDSKCIYLVMEACLGGEVWTILRDKSRFDEEMTRFTVACVLLALEHLHARNVVYRDLKPENLMIGNNGYVKLVDFGFSKIVPNGQRTWTFCGTPEYVAPEVILNRGHDRAVDFWAVGVLLYELLSGVPPWGPMSPDGMGMGEDADALLTYNTILKGERLGIRNGIVDVSAHRWFQGFDWEGLRTLKLKPPIQPLLKSPTDTRHFDRFEAEIENLPPDDLTGWDLTF